MVDEGFANEITDLLKEAVIDIRLEIKDMFKGVRPYRQKKIPPKEQLLWFAENFTSEFEATARQSAGDGAVDDYLLKIRKLAQEDANG